MCRGKKKEIFIDFTFVDDVNKKYFFYPNNTHENLDDVFYTDY